MKYTHTIHDVQQLPTGETHAIHTYTYAGAQPGPTVYVQANLHGSEVIGTRVLALFMQYLNEQEDIPGTVIVVPCANPLAVQATQYNGIAGRWNPNTGTNWNRIFQTKKSTKETVSEAMKHTLAHAASSEERLAATLTLISQSADYCIDLHTSGAATIPHIFRYVADEGVFDALGAAVHLTWDSTDVYGGFDESHVTPYIDTEEPHTYACTWEVHHHNDIDAGVVGERCSQLIQWIKSVWQKKSTDINLSPVVYPLKKSCHLSAHTGGYLMWDVPIGSIVEKGQTYATYYHPETNTYSPALATYSFQIISTYGTYAIAEGEPIAWVTKV